MIFATSIRSSIIILLFIFEKRDILVSILAFNSERIYNCRSASRSIYPPRILSSSQYNMRLPLFVGRKTRTLTLRQFPNDQNSVDPEIIQQEKEQDEENEDILKWLPDREKAKIIQENRWKPAEANESKYSPRPKISKESNNNLNEAVTQDPNIKKKKSAYTEEEEELIEILGGKYFDAPSTKRESGFLGDCTLKEIALDYQVPMCYLADVLCGWGVPPPIDPDGRLGDMVTGEQAFAILEAIHTLDMGALYDRYANYDLVTLCNEYDINVSDAFEMALKEGWNLPFGVRTYLRVEQEERLLEALAKDIW
mmetsp:Transcript_321/g.536  ORF Transcript_321/g.536 Transcript_321/m.536 type:complete len:310 (+) Transcript_321:966-1895(+)